MLIQNERYGRDIDSNDPRLANEARDALGWFIEDIKNERAESELTNGKTLYHAFVKLDIQPRNAATSQMTREDMISVVNGILTLFFQPRNYGPREFEAGVVRVDDHGFEKIVGRSILTFMDEV